MTTTHLDPDPVPNPLPPTDPSSHPTAPAAIAESSGSESSFADAFNDNGQDAQMVGIQDVQQSDSAMTFDSDEEHHSDNQDHPEVNVQPNVALPDASSAIAPLVETPSNLPTNGDVSDAQASHDANQMDADAAEPSNGVAAEDAIDQIQARTSISYQDSTDGGIDIQQLLDNITANAESKAATATSAISSTHPSLPSLPANAGLPPRPQITQQPILPQYAQQDESRKYSTGNPSQAQTNAYRPPPGIISPTAGAPGTEGRNGLLPPPPAFGGVAIPTQSPITQANENRFIKLADSADGGIEDEKPWGPHIQKLYDDFLADERMYVTEGAWERFPAGSRLFIGNLPSEKVTKRDLFHVFHKYGRLAQVSIKQAYGFVQFHDAASCNRALDSEQGQEVRGRKMHLEISKAQRNTRNAQKDNAGGRRSRSPDRSKSGQSGRGQRGGTDRYVGRQGHRDDHARPQRMRDDYRPGRSPSPRGAYRGREGANRGRDFYDGRDRRRSRSRSPPYGFRDQARYRERSPDMRSREAIEDGELQIPRRAPHEVPDVQILLLDQLNRDFVSWVENELRSRGVRTEVLFINPRLPLDAVMRRQILEGVHAVSLLDMRSQNTSKIPLQVFDRQGGADKVRFDEYQDLDPKIVAELVLRAKQAQVQVPYAHPQFNPGQTYQPPQAAAPAIPDLAGLVGQLDNATLQKLLGTLNTPPQQQQQQAYPNVNPGIDLASILGGMRGPQVPQQQAYQAPQQLQYGQQPMAPGYGNPGMQQGAPQQSAQQVQDIMAQLAKFRQ